MKDFLVIGGHGFIGSHFCKRLKKDNCSFDEKTSKHSLITYSCFRVRGEAGVCQADIEPWEFADDCEKRVKRSSE